MNDPDNFLSRWSRRKRESVAQPEKTDGSEASAHLVRGRETDPDTPVSESAAPSVPEFDVGSLPPIESIGAATDISAFMRKGVPAALRTAALRRAWSADPTIRDFMGPTENYWDAAGPDGVPGFGDLGPNLDVKRLVSELFGEITPERAMPDAATSASSSAPSGEIWDGRDEGGNAAHASKESHAFKESEDSQSRRTENAATQKKLPQAQPAQKISRRHGGALPE